LARVAPVQYAKDSLAKMIRQALIVKKLRLFFEQWMTQKSNALPEKIAVSVIF
jgi:hypothetical protein